MEPVEPSTATPIMAITPNAVSPNSSTGAAPVTLSILSITPPWPGKMLPLSLMPANLFRQTLRQIPHDRKRNAGQRTGAERTQRDSKPKAATNGHYRRQNASAERHPPRSCRVTRRAPGANVRNGRPKKNAPDVRDPDENQHKQHPLRAVRQVKPQAHERSQAGTSANTPASAADHDPQPAART